MECCMTITPQYSTNVQPQVLKFLPTTFQKISGLTLKKALCRVSGFTIIHSM